MLLKKLINSYSYYKKGIKVTGLATNSKKIKKGFIFFAIRGFNSNGEKFINEAIKKGAVAIVCSNKCSYSNKELPVIKSSNIRYLLSDVASKFYSSKPKNIIAVTGTNGKTSVADLFFQILSNNKIPVATIGTLGLKYNGKIIKSELTSPDTITLHHTLEKIKKKNIDNVIIEASSHGLHQKRIDHINLKAGIFTNFSQDHLDYHKTMKSYFNSKMHLFTRILKKNKTIICDKKIKEFSRIKSISKKRNLHLIDIKNTMEMLTNIKNLNFNEFQLKNLSMAIEAAKQCKISKKKILNSLSKLIDVNGRLELVKCFPNNVRVFVDYAHTPDALLKTLKSLKGFHGNLISLVFGCGGDRDIKKRSLMAKIASSNCAKIYVTDDNPRSESPTKIRNEIIKHIKNKNNFNIGDRTTAIKKAIQNAEPNEVVLVAGKGHETEQIYKNKIIKISDSNIIKKLKLKIKKFTKKKQNYLQNTKILKEITKNPVEKNFHGIAIDSRLIKKDNIFLTIKGKKRHGKKFISQAINKGAKFVISSYKTKKYGKKLISVKNELQFLNKFASKKRDSSLAKILAITGSAGKTSLKNLACELLKNFGATLSSPKSYNNKYGVPISLSLLETKHKYGIFEVGMSKKGEIDKLTKLIKPEIAIITNIGEAHIENFKNLKGIASAKGEVINNIKKNGTIILNRDDKYFDFLMKKAKLKKLKVVSFGLNKKADVYPSKIRKKGQNNFILIKIRGKTFRLEYKNINIHNILASLSLLNELKLDLSKVSKNFRNYLPSEGRGKIHNIKRYKKFFKLVDESYNANPLSTKNAIETFNSINKGKFKKYLLLGDMLELGKNSEFFHKNLSKVINNSDIDKVFIKGVKSLITYKNLIKSKRGNIFQQEEDMDFTLNNIIANNDYLMIKGSNATGLNNFTRKMIRGY